MRSVISTPYCKGVWQAGPPGLCRFPQGTLPPAGPNPGALMWTSPRPQIPSAGIPRACTHPLCFQGFIHTHFPPCQALHKQLNFPYRQNPRASGQVQPGSSRASGQIQRCQLWGLGYEGKAEGKRGQKWMASSGLPVGVFPPPSSLPDPQKSF